jgi:hydroxymethylglutaryl-CoA synthase
VKIGIEKIDLYAGRLSLDIGMLARARGMDAGYLAREVMCDTRTVVPPFEDGVTLAVNAAKRVVTPSDAQHIGLVIVGTESAVDFGKPISTWVQKYAGMSPRCRSFEVKHACYGGTAALKMAAFWVASGVAPGKKALVVSADYSRCFLGAPWEPIGGGCAVAMLVSDAPDVLELNLGAAGFWTDEIADTFRPTARDEVISDQMSIFSYLDALDGAYGHLEEVVGSVDYRARFKKHIYHAPFPGMARRAHRSLLEQITELDAQAIQADFDAKVSGGLTLARQIGSCYGASNFVCLLGLLSTAEDLSAGDRISLFAYGSGCQGELYEGLLGARARESVLALGLRGALERRIPLSVEQYERNERARDAQIDRASFEPARDGNEDVYARAYDGEGLLVLDGVEDHRRRYSWS